MTTPTIEPGIHYDLSDYDYRQLDAAHYSLLKQFAKTPADAKEYIVNPPPVTDAMRLGSACDAAILTPDIFKAVYKRGPQDSNRTTKAWRDWYNAQSSDAIPLRWDEYDQAMAMRDAAWANPNIKAALGGEGKNQVSVIWTDKTTGELCKARFDRLGLYAPRKWNAAIDLKTAKTANLRLFSQQAAQLCYHVQAAFYLDGLRTFAPAEWVWMWPVVESFRPYKSRIIVAEPELIEQGRADCRKYLDQYHQCKTSGEWPGYARGEEFIGLPSWAYDSTEVFV